MIGSNTIRTLRRYVLYNLLMVPFIDAIYIPYQILWVHLDAQQLLLWLLGSLPMALIANALIMPVVRRVIRKVYG